MMTTKSKILAVWAMMLLSFQTIVLADDLALPSGDLVAPKISHTPNTKPISQGESYYITATVTDNVGVKDVLLFYRTIGATEYKRLLMDNGGNDLYSKEIPSSDLLSPGIQYYIQAEDLAGNTLLHGYSFSPLVVKVNPGKDSEGNPIALFGAGSKSIQLTEQGGQKESIWKNKWLWIGVGVLAASVALNNSGDETSPPPAKPGATMVISAPVPQQ